ncbi:MAG: glycosyltransferase family 1 protein [Spirochaetes bacterium]|nr:MAG: glycosyltransferase family 1 protein [Spirochaetota bacterium]
MKKLKVLVVPSDRTGVSYFRSTNPHIALETNYPEEFHIDVDYEPQLNNDEWLKQYDIIHYHRTLGPYEQMEELLKKFDSLGIVSIMDLDDYWAPGTHHPAYHIIKNNEIDKKIINNLRIARNVTTTTSLFADEIAKLNKNVYVLPNAIDPKEKQFTPKLEKSDRVRIGWLGGSSHLKDLELLNGVVGRLRSDGLLDKVQFVLCGFDTRGTHTIIDHVTKEQKTRPITPMESVWYKYEQIFTDNYKTVSPEYKDFLMKFTQEEYPNVANEPYRRVWTKPISTYASNYNLFDISLAPLEENIFNKVKSQLKVIEAGFHHKAIIAQNFGPYKIDLTNAIQFGGGFDLTANGILIDSTKNHKDWYSSIKKLIQNPEVVTALQENLYNTVKDLYSIDKVTEDRRALYLELINNKTK